MSSSEEMKNKCHKTLQSQFNLCLPAESRPNKKNRSLPIKRQMINSLDILRKQINVENSCNKNSVNTVSHFLHYFVYIHLFTSLQCAECMRTTPRLKTVCSDVLFFIPRVSFVVIWVPVAFLWSSTNLAILLRPLTPTRYFPSHWIFCLRSLKSPDFLILMLTLNVSKSSSIIDTVLSL